MSRTMEIPTEIMKQMATIKLSPTQYRLLFVVWTYTFGFKRDEHELSLGFFATATRCDRRQIQRELKGLEEKRIIYQKIDGQKRVVGFNQNTSEWSGTIGETTNQEKDLKDLKDTAVVDEEDDKNIQFRLIRDHFTKRRGRGLDINVEDEGVIFQMLMEGMPPQFICDGIDRSFETFKPKHPMDRINTFKYIAPRIYDDWTKHNERLEMANGTIVIGSFGKKRSGYKSKTEKTNEYLRQAWEDDRYAEVTNPEIVHGDQSSVPQLRGL